ncbi:hypothetical protein AB0M02_25440 [Actinoplanes sp. NPDC051861]|uniref:hypothetical protein n=1 Tax=Actinoplanes sp. NPDC051861 TaxID=3155170 RepID=UPI00343FB933
MISGVAERSLGSRVLVWGQWVLLAAFLLGSFGVLIMAVVQTGDAGALFDPRLERLDDPKASMPDSVWNPFAWIVGIARLVAMLVFVAGIAGVILGVVAIARSRHVGDRAGYRWSLAGTVAWILVLILMLTPYGRALHSWLLD